MTDPCLLIGDIGGTNARFALADPYRSGFSNELTLACDDYATAERVPTSLILHPQPGLLGASYYVRKLYQQAVAGQAG